MLAAQDGETTPHDAVTLDAAKRKTLPTWIRLGLEKMEREKQRQAEHEEREKLRLQQLSEQQAAVQELLADGASVVLGKSKFVSDSSIRVYGWFLQIACVALEQDSDASSDEDDVDGGKAVKSTAKSASPEGRQDGRSAAVMPPKSRAVQLQELVSANRRRVVDAGV